MALPPGYRDWYIKLTTHLLYLSQMEVEERTEL
jgi:hypothetical protein